MTESKNRKLGIIFSYVSILISILVQLIYTPFLIRMLGQSEYGLYSLINSIIGYLAVLDFGFGNAIIVYTVKYKAKKEVEKEKKLHGMFRLIFIIIGIVAGLLGIGLYFLVPTIFVNTMTAIELGKAKAMMLILAFNLTFTFCFTIYSSIISAYERFIFQKLLSILSTILKPAIMMPLLFVGYKSVSLSIVITAINIFVCLSNYFYCKNKLNIKIKYRGFDKKVFKTIFGYSFFIFLGIIVDKVNWSIDQFVLGAVSGTIAVSIYSVAANINTIFINLSTAISNVFLPKMSKMIANETTSNELTNEFIKVGRIQFYIVFLICTGLIFFGKEFIKIWAGNEFEMSYYVLLILVIPASFTLIQNLGLSIMQAMNKYKLKVISSSIMSIFNIIISVYLAKKYGAVGSAIGTAIVLVVCNILLMNVYYYNVIKINVLKFWKSISKIALSLVVPIIFIFGIMRMFPLTGIVSILVYGTIYTCLYCIFCYKFSMNDYEKNIVDNIFLRMKSLRRSN